MLVSHMHAGPKRKRASVCSLQYHGSYVPLEAKLNSGIDSEATDLIFHRLFFPLSLSHTMTWQEIKIQGRGAEAEAANYLAS